MKSDYKEIAILLICLTALSFLYNYQYAFSKGPYSIHMWRQTDCLALTQGYYDNGLNFFQPSMNFQAGNNGKTVAEFPLFYYINACMWTVFGKSEFLCRLLNVIVSFVGLVYLYKLIRTLLDSPFWAGVITLLVFTSPILVFYANGFLVNVPAIGFIFISWYYFYQFYHHNTSGKYLMISMFFVTLAALLRVTLFYTVSFVYILYFLELFNLGSFGKNGKLYIDKWKQLLLLVIPLVFVAGWVSYAKYYNTLHGTTDIFLMKIIPIWDMGAYNFASLSRKFIHNLSVDILLSYVGMYVFFTLFFFLLANSFKQPPIILVCLFSLSIGCLSFLMLFYQNLNVHDYYLIDVIPFMVIVFVFFILLLKVQYQVIYQSAFLKYFAVLFLVTSILYCTAKHRIRYKSKDDALVDALFFVYTEELYGYWDWFHWDYGLRLEALEHIQPRLDELGIKKDDLVLSIPDVSPNVTLYMIGRKGYSTYGRNNLSTYDQIIQAQENGVKYLIINDKSILHDDRENVLVGKPIAEIKNILIYDIRK
ncbi:MAG TPA: glycosyltransferase family 39 protein [Cytophagaceae bacterium]|jgi:hypothetical protein|nr:glycosyltransferase family 39 protein [Cytophagaceae bacterium]